MKRDFSEDARQQLLSLVAQVENEEWCSFTDKIGDKWYDFQGWIGQLDVQKYINDVNTYHKKVIDKNNTTAENINKIFDNVNDVSAQYRSRFISLLVDLREFKRIITQLSQVVSPGNGNFNPIYIGSGLKNSINEYLSISKDLQTMAGDGLTQEDVSNMGETKLRCILDLYAAAILDNIPSVGLNAKLEIPIGPGVTVYYNVSGKLEGTGDVNINLALEEQKVKLKGYDFSHDLGGGLSGSIDNEGAVSVEGSGENGYGTSVTYNDWDNLMDTTISFSYETVDGPNTYAYKYEINYFEQEMTLEEKVTTDFEVGNISSAIGIKYSNDTNWKPLPVPVPVEVPYPSQIPDFDVDWEALGGIVIIAGVAYYGTKAIIALGAAPATGGLSLALLAV